jgi:hypothetical protein
MQPVYVTVDHDMHVPYGYIEVIESDRTVRIQVEVYTANSN